VRHHQPCGSMELWGVNGFQMHLSLKYRWPDLQHHL